MTYIRLRQGFVYVVAIMDWYSRYVFAWEVSVTLDSSFLPLSLGACLTGDTADDLQYGGSVPNLLKLLSEFALVIPPEIGALNGVFVVLCL